MEFDWDVLGERNDASQDQDSDVQIGETRSRVVGRASRRRDGAIPEGEEGREDQAAACGPRATRSTTIRLPIADIEAAQQIAERRGLPYQTYLKGLLHQALERERKAG
jgi:hypothetical protein